MYFLGFVIGVVHGLLAGYAIAVLSKKISK
jgi:fructose-specific phosphotransferase system IIC component